MSAVLAVGLVVLASAGIFVLRPSLRLNLAVLLALAGPAGAAEDFAARWGCDAGSRACREALAPLAGTTGATRLLAAFPLEPGTERYHYLATLALLKVGDVSGAVSHARHVREAPAVFRALAVHEEQNGRLAPAIALHSVVAELPGASALEREIARADALYLGGDPTRPLARDAYLRALTAAPADVHPYRRLLGLLQIDRDYAEMRHAALIRLRLVPDDDPATFDAAWAAAMQGSVDSALREMQEATARRPGSFELVYGHGLILCSTGGYAKGVDILEGAGRLNPRDPRLHMTLARCVAAAGGGSLEVDRHYRTAVSLWPNNNVLFDEYRRWRVEAGLGPP